VNRFIFLWNKHDFTIICRSVIWWILTFLCSFSFVIFRALSFISRSHFSKVAQCHACGALTSERVNLDISDNYLIITCTSDTFGSMCNSWLALHHWWNYLTTPFLSWTWAEKFKMNFDLLKLNINFDHETEIGCQSFHLMSVTWGIVTMKYRSYRRNKKIRSSARNIWCKF
jgi:hypothetical protein